MKTVLIVGGGEVGLRLATVLLEAGRPMRVLESHRSPLPGLRKRLGRDAVVHGSGTDPAALEAAGIRQAGVVAAVTGSDVANAAVCWPPSSASG